MYNTIQPRRKRKKLFRPFAMEKDVAHDFPEILPIRAERVLEIGLKIAFLAGFDLLQRFWHIDIVRRQHSWLCFRPKLLHFF